MHDLPAARLGLAARLHQAAARHLTSRRWFPSAFRYNLTVGRSPEFVWFRVAKVGTRSIFQALRDAGAGFEIENGIFLHYPPNAWKERLKFAFVRHPVERFLSCFHDRVVDRNHFGFEPAEHERMKNLDAFLGFAERLDLSRCDVHLRLQSRLIDLDHIDFLGRMENFEADLAEVFRRLGLRGGAVPRKNASSRVPGNGLTARQRERIWDLYERDFRIFGYGCGG